MIRIPSFFSLVVLLLAGCGIKEHVSEKSSQLYFAKIEGLEEVSITKKANTISFRSDLEMFDIIVPSSGQDVCDNVKVELAGSPDDPDSVSINRSTTKTEEGLTCSLKISHRRKILPFWIPAFEVNGDTVSSYGATAKRSQETGEVILEINYPHSNITLEAIVPGSVDIEAFRGKTNGTYSCPNHLIVGGKKLEVELQTIPNGAICTTATSSVQIENVLQLDLSLRFSNFPELTPENSSIN